MAPPTNTAPFQEVREKYQQWAKRLKRSMRQTHEAGDKLFVDYAGQTVPVVDASSGEISQAQVFLAELGANPFEGCFAGWWRHLDGN